MKAVLYFVPLGKAFGLQAPLRQPVLAGPEGVLRLGLWNIAASDVPA